MYDSLSALVEGHAVESGQEIDPDRFASELYDLIFGEKVMWCEVERAEAKVPKRSNELLSIFSLDEHPDIKVACISRASMCRHRVPADYHERDIIGEK